MSNVFQFPTSQKKPTRMSLQQLNKYTCAALADGVDPQTTICIHGSAAMEIMPVTGSELANGVYSDGSESMVLLLKTATDYAAADQDCEHEEPQSDDLRQFNKQLARAIETLGVTNAVDCMAKAMLDAAHASDADFRVEGKRGTVTIERPDPFEHQQEPSDVKESWSNEIRRFDILMFFVGVLCWVGGFVLAVNGFRVAFYVALWTAIALFVCSSIYCVVKRVEYLGCLPAAVGCAIGAFAMLAVSQAG
ncbi:hypothetical protein [Pseudomonas sp. NPDC089569]|uniref:hypothetical protein n=1 Tax=Pseudomonas sp. NPDC089569 TaxID=3390722 RepID=UPI003D038EAD